jgi:hypothetical protein
MTISEVLIDFILMMNKTVSSRSSSQPQTLVLLVLKGHS